MDLSPPQMVAIDGLQVRRIREEKRLTQLYVAKVVGVTTDTVSRWENNRYPSIRRDNAINLAEALEVELEEILKQEQGEEAGTEPVEPATVVASSVGRKPWIIALVIVVIVVAGFALTRLNDAAPVLTAERIVPPYAAPGSRILIRDLIRMEKPLKGMIVKESFPSGWRLIAADPEPSSSSDAVSPGARWIFRNPAERVVLFYLVEVAADATLEDTPVVGGELIANPEGNHFSVPLQTSGQMRIAPLHWADTNANQVIDDLEILAVSELTEQTELLNEEWDRIEALWDAGAYVWSPGQHDFVPAVPASE